MNSTKAVIAIKETDKLLRAVVSPKPIIASPNSILQANKAV